MSDDPFSRLVIPSLTEEENDIVRDLLRAGVEAHGWGAMKRLIEDMRAIRKAFPNEASMPDGLMFHISPDLRASVFTDTPN